MGAARAATAAILAAAGLALSLPSASRAQPPRCDLVRGVAAETLGRYDAIILRESARRGLNPRLVKAVIAAESQFSPRARSPRGARGLMQLLPSTAQELGVLEEEDLQDPETNIRAGTEYLARLSAQARRRRPAGASARIDRRVIAAYHAGPRAIESSDWKKSTRQYVRTVLDCYRSEASAVSPRRTEPERVYLARRPGEIPRP